MKYFSFQLILLVILAANTSNAQLGPSQNMQPTLGSSVQKIGGLVIEQQIREGTGSGAVSYDGNILFQSTGSKIFAIDISVPETPVNVGSYGNCDVFGEGSNVGYQCFHDIREIKASISENILYRTGRFQDGGWRQVFEIINFSNPSEPQLVSRFESESELYGFAISPNEDFVYLASLEGGVKVLDISVKSSPVQIFEYSSPTLTTDVEISSSGDVLFVTNGLGGAFQVFDVSTPTAAQILGELSLPDDNIWDVELSRTGNTATLNSVSGGSRYLHLVDIENPASLKAIGKYWENNREVKFVEEGQTIVTADDSALNFYSTEVFGEHAPPAIYNFNFDGTAYSDPQCGGLTPSKTSSIVFLSCYTESQLNSQSNLAHIEVLQIQDVSDSLSSAWYSDSYLTVPIMRAGDDYYRIELVLNDLSTLEFNLNYYVQLDRQYAGNISIFSDGKLSVPVARVDSTSYALEMVVTGDNPVTLKVTSAQ